MTSVSGTPFDDVPGVFSETTAAADQVHSLLQELTAFVDLALPSDAVGLCSLLCCALELTASFQSLGYVEERLAALVLASRQLSAAPIGANLGFSPADLMLLNAVAASHYGSAPLQAT